MPQNNIPDSPTGSFDFTGVEGADLSFDDLFGHPDQGLPVSGPQGDVAPSAPPVEPPAPPPAPEFILDAGTSKYKTLEDATRGVHEKDTLIETLRQEFIARTGVDPITRRPVTVTPPAPTRDSSYMSDPAQFTKDLREAVEKGDDQAYARAQIKLVNDLLQPVAPLITGYAKQNAQNEISKEITEFQTFRSSPDFNSVMDKNPILGNAIKTAEGDYTMHDQLPELYRVAYWASMGLKTPDLVRAAQAQAVPVAQPQPPVRQPMGNSSLAPPTPSARPTVSTHEGRKALISQFEAGGGLDLKF